jgi:CheY-like chemotaxis protein
MPDREEYRWVKSTANELNNLLQVISESSQMLETLCQGTIDTDKYFAMMRTAVDRAAKVTQVMIDRVGGVVGSTTDAGPFPVMEKSAVHPKEDIKIFNPHGPLELVMLVDDEEFVTMLAERVLADAGYRVITARDGLEAITFYRKLGKEISLILLDFTMPVMDGADVFNELLQMNPGCLSSFPAGSRSRTGFAGCWRRGCEDLSRSHTLVRSCSPRCAAPSRQSGKI